MKYRRSYWNWRILALILPVPILVYLLRRMGEKEERKQSEDS